MEIEGQRVHAHLLYLLTDCPGFLTNVLFSRSQFGKKVGHEQLCCSLTFLISFDVNQYPFARALENLFSLTCFHFLFSIKTFFSSLKNQWFSGFHENNCSSVIRQKGESQNGCFKKANHAKFSEKCSFFGKFDVLCFLENKVLLLTC